MNRLKTIGLFAGIFAITMGAISLSDTSESFFMVSTIPQSQENIGMLGHVEYTVRDASDNIKAYMQTDNIVTTQGKDCVAQGMFDSGESVDQCTSGTAQFNYIAIGNHTTAGVPVNTLDALETSGAAVCASSTVDGEMARKLVDPSFLSTGSNTVVTLDTVSDPFDFGVSNATIVMQSGVFNADETLKDSATGECTTVGTADMFAVQDLSLDAGITVSDGDSLSVKWTITVG